MTELSRSPLGVDVALAARAGRYALDEIGALAIADLDRPTPCADWDVRSVVAHLADVAGALAGLLATGRLTMPQSPARPVDGPMVGAQRRVQQLLDQLHAAGEQGSHGRPAPWATEAAHGAAIEFTAHGWDVAAARGRAQQLPADLAEDVLTLVSGLLDDSARGTSFAAQVISGPDASPVERLVAFTGRDPAPWIRSGPLISTT
ncbi:maleylpyruvate isomerase family mycothiol-dependent enzyme [Modestobacter sp. VKM Ac-2978]|uniref:maleylpyruvate isomerase family mycothiol-dependent enzyme n=1 Tax=Modestobacter sp. VKM Ac-2978 TaxID=3004132 RepID=UPI0022AA47AE|nr:maleylpyruvate isomerase family mycothiol-dependent enzyme [Modestobacter sp. VKM Ac-2978]MCZ2850899.1 maleylpyruvate isomerase family mycothiol-dependent enzyme [Modestobacter sp. VKM Ac-2978]